MESKRSRSDQGEAFQPPSQPSSPPSAASERSEESKERAESKAQVTAAVAVVAIAGSTYLLWRTRRSHARTLATSGFKAVYDRPDSKPQFHDQLESAVRGLISAHARRARLPKAHADTFFTTLRTNALTTAIGSGGTSELLQPSHLAFIAVRLWTSAATLGGREFCSILNQAIREDTDATLTHAAIITHALNAFCVTRRIGTPVRWPSEHVTYRGTALPQCHRAFFTAGKRYRAPAFLATSFRQDVSVNRFLGRLDAPSGDQVPPFQEPTLWRFHLDSSLPAEQRCVHVNFIDRTDGTVHREDEFLFTPYSVFKVRAVQWVEAPLVNAFSLRYHIIDVDVAPDNRREPDDLPLAPWS